MHHSIKTPLLVLAMLTALTACQSQPKKSTQTKPPAKGVTIQIKDAEGKPLHPDKDVQWSVLQSLAATTLKSGDSKHTGDILDSMLAAAGEDPRRWQAMAQIVAGLPAEDARRWLSKLTQAASNTHTAEIPLTLSQLAMAMDDSEKAMQLANQALARDENNPKSRFWHARLLELNKNTLQAQAEYQWLSTHFPDNPEYAEALANNLRQQGQLEAAEAIYAKLPQNREVLFKRLLLAMQRHQNDRAKALFAQLKEIPLDPQLSPEQQDRQWYLQGEAAWLLEQDTDALAAYRRVKGGRYYTAARFRIATLLDKQDQDQQALEVLRRLQNYDRDTATQAAIYRATILNNRQRSAEAFAVLDQALRYQPENIDLLYARGLLHERHGDLAAMEKDLKAILDIDPNNATALNALGYSLADHNIKLTEARQYLQKALKLEPDNPAIIDSVGWLQYRLGNYAEAETLLRKALKLSGDDPDIYLHLIKTLQARGRLQEAAALLKEAQSTFPQHNQLQALH